MLAEDWRPLPLVGNQYSVHPSQCVPAADSGGLCHLPRAAAHSAGPPAEALRRPGRRQRAPAAPPPAVPYSACGAGTCERCRCGACNGGPGPSNCPRPNPRRQQQQCQPAGVLQSSGGRLGMCIQPGNAPARPCLAAPACGMDPRPAGCSHRVAAATGGARAAADHCCWAAALPGAQRLVARVAVARVTVELAWQCARHALCTACTVA